MSKTFEEQLREGLIAPGTPFKLTQAVEIGFEENQLKDLKESFNNFKLTESKGTDERRKLIVTVEGIHTGMTKNKTFYPGTTLEASVPTWLEPHNKPVLKNHNEYTEPLGRVVHAEYGESTLTDKYTVKMKLAITDQETIEKILDGRYLTLSVGGSANKVTCSACGKDLVTEGYCGHRRGQTYEGKEAYWMIANYTGDEISFVNMPADVHAQVIAAELVSEKGDSKVGKENTNPENGGIQTQENTDPTSVIDGILNENQQQQEPPATPAEPVQTQENEQPPATEPENEDPQQQTESVDELKAKIAKLESDLTEANNSKDLVEAENMTLKSNLAEATGRADTAEASLETAENERKKMVEQNVTLARYARQTLAERVADLKVLSSTEEIDRASILKEFEGQASSVLESQIKDLLTQAATVSRTVGSVDNPGLATNENHAPIVDEDDEPIKKPQESKISELPTLKSFEKTMYASAFRTNEL